MIEGDGAATVRDLEEENSPSGLDAGGDAERLFEREMDLTQRDAVDAEHSGGKLAGAGEVERTANLP